MTQHFFCSISQNIPEAAAVQENYALKVQSTGSNRETYFKDLQSSKSTAKEIRLLGRGFHAAINTIKHRLVAIMAFKHSWWRSDTCSGTYVVKTETGSFRLISLTNLDAEKSRSCTLLHSSRYDTAVNPAFTSLRPSSCPGVRPC